MLHLISEVFLKRYVKPSDSAKARAALPLLKQQELSVETYGAQFKAMNGRITVGSPIDGTSLAILFYQGLSRRIANVILHAQPLSTLHDLDKLIAVAEEVEAKLDLAAKQGTAPGPTNSFPSRGRGHSTHGGGGRIRTNHNNVLNSVQAGEAVVTVAATSVAVEVLTTGVAIQAVGLLVVATTRRNRHLFALTSSAPSARSKAMGIVSALQLRYLPLLCLLSICHCPHHLQDHLLHLL